MRLTGTVGVAGPGPSPISPTRPASPPARLPGRTSAEAARRHLRFGGEAAFRALGTGSVTSEKCRAWPEHDDTETRQLTARNTALQLAPYLFRRGEGLTEPAHSFITSAIEVEFSTARKPLRRATVDVSCSCGSQNFGCVSAGLRAIETILVIRSFPVGAIIAATRCPHGADSAALLRRRMTWLLVL